MIDLTIFKNGYEVDNGTHKTVSFDELVELSENCFVHEDKVKAPLAFFGKLEDNTRKKPMKVKYRDGIVLDFDHTKTDITDRIREALKGYQWVMHRTYSHDPNNDDYCLRVTVMTSEKIQEKDYQNAYWNFIHSNPELSKLQDESCIDVRGQDALRCFFLHSSSPERKEHTLFDYSKEGVPYRPDTRNAVPVTKPSSPKANGLKHISEPIKAYLEPMVYEGTGMRNAFEASKIGDLINQYRNKDQVLEEMLKINQTQIAPPEPEDEIRRQVDNIWDKHIANNPVFRPVDEDHPLRKTYTIDDLEKIESEEDWLIEGVMENHSMNAIYGASQSTKSFLAIDLAFHLSLGMEWFGYKVMKPVPVIYVAVEGGNGIKRRVKAWRLKHNNIKPKNLLIDKGAIVPTNKQNINDFITHYQKRGFDDGVIIIDTLNASCRSSGLDENSTKDMGLIVNAYETITKALNSSYIVIHHTGKDETKGMRGSSSLFGALDFVMLVTRKENAPDATWTLEKNKEGEQAITYRYTFPQVEIGGFNSKGEPITSLCVMPDGQEAVTKDDKVNLQSARQKMIWRMTKKLLAPIPTHRIDMEALKDYFHENWSTHEQSKRRHDGGVTLEQLKNKGLLDFGTWSDYQSKEKIFDQVWLTKKGLKNL